MSAIIRNCGRHSQGARPPRAHRNPNPFARALQLTSLLLLLAPSVMLARQAVDEDAPWPRIRSTNGNTVTLYLPEVESWTSNSFRARSVVEVKTAKPKKTVLGVVWFDAHGTVDRTNRIVDLDRLEITRGNFPEASNNGSNVLAIVQQLFPGGARTVSLDYLITALGFEQAAARQNAQEYNHTPPEILWQTNRAVLVILDGDPVLRPIPGSSMERVINTAGLMIRNPADGKFYLSGGGQWFSADSLQGSWSLVQVVPPDVAALSPPLTNSPPTPAQGSAPKIILSTKPSELLISDGLPDFKSIPGTSLQYAANADGLLFFDAKEGAAYLLLSGRWFKAATLQGPWSYVSPDDLPADFAKIPKNSPRAMVLASVPGTPEAELSSVASSLPTTATVSRDTKINLTYDGQPQFKPIEGTAMSYAINAQLPVISLGTNFYAMDDAVWFVASSPTGQWEVATEVPEEIYTIPPSSPVYYATFARIYDSDTNSVEVGYTPGYTGSYEDDGTTVYGTGYDYDSYYGDDYYGWGWTYGYGYWYVPWYGWWVWRPWWGAGNGLRAAMIDNIYDRWNTPGVRPHDRLAGTAAKVSALQNGYPALYGRFTGTTGRTPFLPPADTIALNPYSRTLNALRPGETPRGAQLLSDVRKSSGGGRDLYAAPDGNIYQRRTDGWYRQAAAGKWDYFAPAQGAKLNRSQIAVGNAVAGGGQNRAAAQSAVGARAQARGYQGGNGNWQGRQQVAADLDRQYYARQVGQARAQNMRSQPARGRPMRAGGRGRR